MRELLVKIHNSQKYEKLKELVNTYNSEILELKSFRPLFMPDKNKIIDFLSELLSVNETLLICDISANRLTSGYIIQLFTSIINNENSLIHHVSLRMNAIKNEGAFAIANGLKINNTIRYLNISYAMINEEGIMALMESLKYNTTLTHLDLSDNRIDNYDNTKLNGSHSIADMLKNNKTLIALHLSRNYIPNNAIKIIAKSFKFNNTLSHLSLDYCDITDDGAIALDKYVKKYNSSLIYLCINKNRIAHHISNSIKDSIDRNNTNKFTKYKTLQRICWKLICQNNMKLQLDEGYVFYYQQKFNIF